MHTCSRFAFFSLSDCFQTTHASSRRACSLKKSKRASVQTDIQLYFHSLTLLSCTCVLDVHTPQPYMCQSCSVPVDARRAAHGVLEQHPLDALQCHHLRLRNGVHDVIGHKFVKIYRRQNRRGERFMNNNHKSCDHSKYMW